MTATEVGRSTNRRQRRETGAPLGMPCITTWSGRRGCMVQGEHLTGCARADSVDGSLASCPGCLPQPARYGLACASCRERFEAAVSCAVDLVLHLRSGKRSFEPVGSAIRARSGPRFPLPHAWLVADEIWAALYALASQVDPLAFLDMIKGGTGRAHLGARATPLLVRDALELAVALVRSSARAVLEQPKTAHLAVAFYRKVQQALAMFPMEDPSRTVAYARCRECGQQTLERRPPLQYLEPITVRCSNPGCGTVFDPAMIEFDLSRYRAELAQHGSTVGERNAVPAQSASECW